LFAGPANGVTTLFSDDFEEETGYGIGYYASLSQWDVTGGFVDLIGYGSPWDYEFGAAQGLYVDLEHGLPYAPGLMTTKTSFVLLPGYVYTLTYELAGNQEYWLSRGGPSASDYDVVVVGFAGKSASEHVSKTQSFETYSMAVRVASETSTKISIQCTEGAGDNQGALLDNVSLMAEPESSVASGVAPAPGGLILAAFGAAFVGWARSRAFL
jgi:hypothetical protein